MPKTLPSYAFVRVALPPYRRGEAENPIIINTGTIERIDPPSVTREIDPRTGCILSECVPEPRYGVTFRAGGRREFGKASPDDLTAAGVHLPA